MLKRLVISNLAIIENVDISFGNGFTVLMGGTGAGKSLVIDSLSLLLGARASSDLIRQGEDKATIQGYFEVKNAHLDALLTKFGVPSRDGELLLERTLSKGKSTSRVNGVVLSNSDLAQIAPYLANIHTQFESQKLLNPENYLSILDGFNDDLTSAYKKEYASLLSTYREKKKAYADLLAKKQKLEEAKDFCQYQYSELKGMNLQDGEKEEIENEISLIRHYDEIYSLSQQADSLVRGEALDDLYELDSLLKKLSSFQPQYQESQQKVDDAYYELQDLFDDLKEQFKNLDYDPNRLNDLEQRDEDLLSLERKYKKSIPELIAYRDELQGLLGNEESFGESIASAKEEMAKAMHECFEKGKELSLLRQKIASSIEKELEQNLRDLLLNAHFKVSFAPVDEKMGEGALREDGIDQVDFLLEANVGEGYRPMADTISGGEASRILLAFKALFIKANKVPTAVFDEIDTGISGQEAFAVAKKIYEISLSTQVLAITHAPQVASFSDHAILIKKQVKQGRTYTSMKELSLPEKIEEVAHLISSGEVTDAQRRYAEEMILAKH